MGWRESENESDRAAQEPQVTEAPTLCSREE